MNLCRSGLNRAGFDQFIGKRFQHYPLATGEVVL